MMGYRETENPLLAAINRTLSQTCSVVGGKTHSSGREFSAAVTTSPRNGLPSGISITG